MTPRTPQGKPSGNEAQNTAQIRLKNRSGNLAIQTQNRPETLAVSSAPLFGGDQPWNLL